ncbi:hypothetical protein GCM10010361_15410 [Streptomyces olivaceiscleroticus]|uniref:DUF4177 domain-containing protein n=1 Tax=Streptomyces olivaceiscleroticus TaxID=68245 RepID=A0ABP3JH78_9ACTN
MWEYRVIQGANWHQQLDAAGLEGWEAVGVVPTAATLQTDYSGGQNMKHTAFAVLMKRPKD